MTNRRLTACVIGLVAASVTACSSNVSGHGSQGGSPNSASTGSSAGGSAASATGLGPNTTPAQLAAALTSALSKVKSAHISLTASVLGQSITGVGDEKLANGKLQAFQITENLPGGVGSVTIVLVGTKAWIKVPTALGSSGSKPWRVISANSSNATVRSLASSLDSTLSSASIASAGRFAQAAKSVKVLGKQNVGGTQATRVHIVVDPTKVPSTLPGQSSSLQKLGLTSIPVDLYLDDQNRPVLTTTSLAVQGQTATTKVAITNYDQPVAINPPPASEVAPG
jgi:hypothetical protein